MITDPTEPVLGAGLDAIFNPSGIAIIGASNDANRIGGRPIAFMRRGGYAGPIYPINPARTEVQGIAAFASIGQVGEPIDLGVIAVPANLVQTAVDDSIEAGVKALAVFTSGFAEVGDEGAEAQRRIRDRCLRAGVRMIGPNSLGLMNVRAGMYLTFSTVMDAVKLQPGGAAIVTQSGAFGAYFCGLASRRGIGLSQFVATGNEADVDISDCIAWLSSDPQTSVIVAYIEGCRDGSRLRQALHLAAAAGKPVVVYKAGSSAAGAAAVNSHTGSLAGSDAVWDAILAEAGALRANSIQSMLDMTYALSLGRQPRDRSVGIISGSGGVGIALADAVSAVGLDLKPMPAEAQAEIKSMNAFASPANPVDVTAQVLNDLTLFGRMLRTMLQKGEYATAVVFLMQYAYNPAFFASWKSALLDVKKDFPDRLFVLCMDAPEAEARFLESQGFLLFSDPLAAAEAIACLARELPPIAEQSSAGGHAAAGQTSLDEAASRALLEEVGVRFAPQSNARTANEAAEAAAELGYPVVLKILSADIAHKSEAGGVRVNLRDEAAVRAAWRDIMASVAATMPDAAIDGMIVAKMIEGGVETIIGLQRDETFGPIIMFGLGGVSVELFGDVVFRPAPLSRIEAERMVRSIKGFPLLDGFRGRPPIDLDSLCDTLVRMSSFAERHPDVLSAEINPFIALPDGGAAVDALVVK